MDLCFDLQMITGRQTFNESFCFLIGDINNNTNAIKPNNVFDRE